MTWRAHIRQALPAFLDKGSRHGEIHRDAKQRRTGRQGLVDIARQVIDSHFGPSSLESYCGMVS